MASISGLYCGGEYVSPKKYNTMSMHQHFLKLEEWLHSAIEKKDLKKYYRVTGNTFGIVRTTRLLHSATILNVHHVHVSAAYFYAFYITASACESCKNKKL